MTRYGYAVVFVGAFLEATPVVNFYLPGSTIIILAVALSREGYMNVFVVLAIATTAFLLSYILDYAMGRYGWYTLMLRCGLGSALDRAQKRVSRHGPKWIFPSYVHPNIGAITSTACGILRIPFSRFVPYSLVALIVWDSLWGALTYYESSFILRFANTKWLILVVAAWLLFVIIREIRSGSEE
jgi:membrane protein DedA with SNARE-associated domain